MTSRLTTLAVLGVVAVAIAVLALGRSGDEPYHLTVKLDNAYGLRTGSTVQAGGINVGKVGELRLGRGDDVEAILDIDHDKGPVGSGTRIQIKAKNLLGEKYLALSPGDRARPAPSGTVVPASRVTVPVDLDQVLGVLDPETRTKLKVLIGEAGASLVGRGKDLNALLAQLPPTLDSAHDVLDQVVSDNQTLGELIDRSSRFVATFAPQRAQVSRLIDRAGQTAATIKAKNPELRRTLAEAPPTLRQLRAFLADLQSTTVPLGPAARTLAKTADPLRDTLAAIPAFQTAAEPTLDEATRVAPDLTRLGKKATPVLRRATPTLQSLATFGRALQPLSRTLGLSVDDLLATLQGWSRAIQARDGLTHVFRAKVGISVDSLRGIVSRLGPARTTQPAASAKKTPAAKQKPSEVLPDVLQTLTGTKKPDKPAVKLPPVPGAEQTADSVQSLLDYLLKP